MDDVALKSIIKEAIHESQGIVVDEELHATHHQFIEMMMEKEERRIARWEKIRTQVYGWGIITALGLIGSAVYSFFFDK